MTKAELSETLKYVRVIADKMELRDWLFEVDSDPDTDCIASVRCVKSQKLGIIDFSNEFWRSDPPEQRETVVHELLHIHHEICWRMVQSDLAEALGKPTYYVFCDAYRRAMEYQIDAISRSLAPFMPLPEFKKAK